MEGIIRSRARFHEHGERNSKYFLNIEKRNYVKKHIRKPCLSGVNSTDPLEFLEAERAFYENLYIDEMVRSKYKPNFNFEDFPIPTLSNDSSDLGEGLSGSLSKSGPLHFGSEKSFPSNFSQ